MILDRDIEKAQTRSGMTIIKQPEWAGRVVSMTQFNSRVIVACEFGVFWLNGEVFEPIKFVTDGGALLAGEPK